MAILLASLFRLLVIDLILDILKFFIVVILLICAVLERCEGFNLFLHLVVYFLNFLLERQLSASSKTLSLVSRNSHSNLGLDSALVGAINQIVGVSSEGEPFSSWQLVFISVIKLLLF